MLRPDDITRQALAGGRLDCSVASDSCGVPTFATPCCRLSGHPVATVASPKPCRQRHLRLLSPKTRFATEWTRQGGSPPKPPAHPHRQRPNRQPFRPDGPAEDGEQQRTSHEVRPINRPRHRQPARRSVDARRLFQPPPLVDRSRAPLGHPQRRPTPATASRDAHPIAQFIPWRHNVLPSFAGSLPPAASRDVLAKGCGFVIQRR